MLFLEAGVVMHVPYFRVVSLIFILSLTSLFSISYIFLSHSAPLSFSQFIYASSEYHIYAPHPISEPRTLCMNIDHQMNKRISKVRREDSVKEAELLTQQRNWGRGRGTFGVGLSQ